MASSGGENQLQKEFRCGNWSSWLPAMVVFTPVKSHKASARQLCWNTFTSVSGASSLTPGASSFDPGLRGTACQTCPRHPFQSRLLRIFWRETMQNGGVARVLAANKYYAILPCTGQIPLKPMRSFNH